MKYRFTKEDLEIAVKKSMSIAGVCRELNIKPVGGNYKTIKNKFKVYEIDTSHFTGKGWNQGERFRPFGKKYSLDEILIKNSSYFDTHCLKKRLFNEKIKENKCELCGINEWNNEKIVCELDHINGDNSDNRIENIRILCPNCHSQTPTFRNKNKVSKRNNRKNFSHKTNKNNVKKKRKTIKKKRIIREKPKCKICNETCSRHNCKYCSKECYRKDTNKNIPKVPELLNSFKKFKTFKGVGGYYNVSDNAVRKWCDNYGILNMINL